MTLILVLSPTLFFFSLLLMTSRYERHDLDWHPLTDADPERSAPGRYTDGRGFAGTEGSPAERVRRD